MEMINEILENELRNAVEVKDKQTLHRYIALLSENLVGRKQYAADNFELKNDLKEMYL